MKSHVLTALALFGTLLGCPATIPGPTRPLASDVSSIRVIPIAPSRAVPHDVSDRVPSIVSSYAFSEQGWTASQGRVLKPQYRLDFLKGSQIVAVYWLGTNSDPPELPCYTLCTGWWVGASTEAGAFDGRRYKGLPDAVYFPLLRDLRI